eukprot:gene49571-67313_t
MGYTVEERDLSIDEIKEAYENGSLREAFGTGTAATISMIRELKYKDFVMLFDTDKWTVSPELKQRLNAVRYGLAPDVHGWMLPNNINTVPNFSPFEVWDFLLPLLKWLMAGAFVWIMLSGVYFMLLY